MVQQRSECIDVLIVNFICSIKCAFVGENNFNIIKMHGTTIKIIDAQQAKLRNDYKNTKLKLLKTNAEIWFNKGANA
jgi:hypothetical protein